MSTRERDHENPIRDAIAGAIGEHEVILFMKGTPEQPMCGFSARTAAALEALGKPYAAVDVLPDPRIRQELSAISDWPTIPQLFVGGELVGGCDIVTEMYESGELAQVMGVEPPTDAPAEAPEAAEPGAPPLQIDNKLTCSRGLPHSLLAFLPVAAVLTLTPGVATALVIRSAVRGGRREALPVTVGNSLGVLAWAMFAAVGVAAVVAASAELFTTIKLAGAVVLVILGLQGLLARKADAPPPPPGTALRVGLVTSLANPKLAVFFVALFPQFIPEGSPVLPSALGMAATIVALDLVCRG